MTEEDIERSNADIPTMAEQGSRDLIERPNADVGTMESAPLLDMKTIAERLGVSYAKIRAFADAPGVPEALGARAVPGVKGVRYPDTAVEAFRQLLDRHARKLITPAAAAAFLRERANADNGALTPLAALGLAAPVEGAAPPSAAELLAALHALPDRIAEAARAAAPPVEDSLITAADAAALLACKPASVRRMVKPVLRGRWRRSDVLRFIEGLGRETP